MITQGDLLMMLIWPLFSGAFIAIILESLLDERD